jgi:hypothetical protein
LPSGPSRRRPEELGLFAQEVRLHEEVSGEGVRARVLSPVCPCWADRTKWFFNNLEEEKCARLEVLLGRAHGL